MMLLKPQTMNVLSLFTGAGGGELAFQHLLTEFRTIGYVEIDEYCQKVIRQRIKDGLLDAAPIFGDIRLFIENGYARAYQGMVDVITAGFPCQPFSVAGKQLAEKDNRNLWPETIKTIRTVKPATIFLENIPGLLASEYALTIFRQLRENGYQTLPALKLGADDIGANHIRKRFWIVADSGGSGRQQIASGTHENEGKNEGRPEKKAYELECNGQRNRGEVLAHSARIHQGWQKPRAERKRIRSCCESIDMANATEPGLSQPACREIGSVREPERTSEGCKSGRRMSTPGRNWTTEPALGRVAHGVANRVDRLKAIGNGQVPQVAATAWEILKP